MKLKTQFFLGAGILIVVLVAMATFAVVTRVQVAGLQDQHEITTSLQEKASDLADLSSNYLLYQEPVHRARWNAVFESFSRDVDRLKVTESQDLQLISSIRSNAARLQQVFADIVSTIGAGTQGETAGSRSFLQVPWSRMEVQNRQIMFSAARLEELLELRTDRANLVSAVALFAMLGVFGLLLLGGYIFMYRRTIAGIAALHTGTETVGRGDLDYVIPGERRDEIGDLSRAFNAMTGDLRNVTASKAELEREMAERKQAEAERERLFSKQEELAGSLAAVNEELRVQNDDLAAREEELAAQNEELRTAHEETARLLVERNSLYERLQTGLLHIPREIPGVRFSHLYRSATEQAQVGGDFYDVFETKNHRIGLLIGDVSGHGIEAARIASLVKDTVHAFAHQSSRPHHVLRETNRLLVGKKVPGFVTVFLGFLDPESGRLTYCAAGHPGPLVARDGRVTPLDSASLPLGVFPDARYRDREVGVEEGSLLLLYTDGITEARRDSDFFGEHRLAVALQRMGARPLEKVPLSLFEEVLHFSGGHLRDDAAILAVEYRR